MTSFEIFICFWVLPSLIAFLAIVSAARYIEEPPCNWDIRGFLIVIVVSLAYPLGLLFACFLVWEQSDSMDKVHEVLLKERYLFKRGE